MSFENPEAWLLALRAGLLLAAFAALAWALVASRREAAMSFLRLSAQHSQALNEIQQLGVKLSELRAQVHDLSLPAPMVTPRPVPAPPPQAMAPAMPSITPSGARGYEMAIRMARAAASIDEIVASCGTTRSEARLLRRLHCASGATAA
ncbi:MAG TPA: DUF2802 domain-containing protein [Steroidobacteraceae bacterium]|jgi:hypothetical protein|nr:DUF2802 domain-containing protein [Steroidobacteraceae bacterium]